MTQPIPLTHEQRAIVDDPARVSLIVGAPGTGKTTLAVEMVAARVRAGILAPDQVMVLAATRTAASSLRQRIVARVGGTTTAPPARTASSVAFSILHTVSVESRTGDGPDLEVPDPRLLSGAEQDLILAELLAGHRETGTGPNWPANLTKALPTRGFRDQLRDLLMRAVEHGLDPADLADLGSRHGRPEWVAAAEVFSEYDEVTALARPGAFDPAWICTSAARAIAADDDLAARVRSRVRLLIVDDAQELTASAAELVVALAGSTATLILLGDPDATVHGFRGAEPGRMVAVADRVAQASATRPVRHHLTQSHRLNGPLAAVAGRVVDRIGVPAATGIGHRHPAPAVDDGIEGSVPAVRVVTPQSDSQQLALVADALRRWHLLDGVPWEQMAVITRTRSLHEGLRRAMSRVGVPVALPGGGLRLVDQPAVQMVMLAYDVVLRPDPRPTPAEAVTLLTSPLGGADPGTLRRLRHLASQQATRPDDGEDGHGHRDADEVLADLLAIDPDRPDGRLVADRIALALGSVTSDRASASSVRPGDSTVSSGVTAMRGVARVLSSGVAAAGGTPGQVLWALWSASNLAEPWERAALRPGPSGDRAGRDLDALVTLFAAAEQFTERLGEMPAAAFLDHVRAQEIASDSLVAAARPDDAVEVLTPQTAAGRQWRRVLVVGVQESVWPDLRIRDTLLGAQSLADLLNGRDVDGHGDASGSRESVRVDELRQFHVALTRASEHLSVVAVDSTDERPSSFIELLGVARETEPVVPDRMTLRGVMAELRRSLVLAGRAGDARAAERAVAGLVTAAEHDVDGADPDRWWGATLASDERPLREPDQVVLSPSHLQAYTECPLRWLLGGRGGRDTAAGTAAAIGTLIHDVIASDPDADASALQRSLEAQWSTLGLGSGWIVDRQKADAMAMLERYVRYAGSVRDDGFTKVEVERAYDEQIGPARVTARVDRVEYREDGTARVVDLKTGQAKVSRAEAERNPQLGVYQLVVDPERPAQEGAALVYLANSSPNPVVRTQRPVEESGDASWVHALIAEAAGGMTTAQFAARPGPWCQTCPVRSSCPAQSDGEVIAP